MGKHFSATIKEMETVSRKVIATRAMPALFQHGQKF
jgi:hypothetical protein